MIWVGLVLFALIVLLYPVTDGSIRLIAGSTIRRGKLPGHQIHLSFDDGPDPVNTPLLLKILEQKQVPACFFLVGEKAESYPELVQAIHQAGHEIGWHTFYHRHAYLLTPFSSCETVHRGKFFLEQTIGEPLRWFRPPWGALNFFEWISVKKSGLKVVLWTANARDWKKSTGKVGIIRRLKQRVKPNSIIVLHDAGGEPGAPGAMLAALPEIIDDWRQAGYTFVSLHEITGGIHGR